MYFQRICTSVTDVCLFIQQKQAHTSHFSSSERLFTVVTYILFIFRGQCRLTELKYIISFGFFPCRIREVADKINKYGSQTPQILQSLKAAVKQVVIGPAHLGLLLEDGRALRVAFSVIPERLDLSKSEPTKS